MRLIVDRILADDALWSPGVRAAACSHQEALRAHGWGKNQREGSRVERGAVEEKKRQPKWLTSGARKRATRLLVVVGWRCSSMRARRAAHGTSLEAATEPPRGPEVSQGEWVPAEQYKRQQESHTKVLSPHRCVSSTCRCTDHLLHCQSLNQLRHKLILARMPLPPSTSTI